MANKKELLILGAAVASATAGMYFYTDRKRDWNEPLGLKDQKDQPKREIALSDTVIEKEVLEASAAMDLSESPDGDDGFTGKAKDTAPLSADNELVKEPKTPTWSRHQKLSETVIEKKVLDASAAMDSGCLSESNDANAAHEMYEKFLTK